MRMKKIRLTILGSYPYNRVYQVRPHPPHVRVRARVPVSHDTMWRRSAIRFCLCFLLPISRDNRTLSQHLDEVTAPGSHQA